MNADGTATIWAVTSTVSGNGDQGADPNKLVAITDPLAPTTMPANESFVPVDAAGNGEVLRGVSFTPRYDELTLVPSCEEPACSPRFHLKATQEDHLRALTRAVRSNR